MNVARVMQAYRSQPRRCIEKARADMDTAGRGLGVSGDKVQQSSYLENSHER